MSNKINIRQESSEYHPKVRSESLKKLAKNAMTATGLGLAGAAVVAGGTKVGEAQQPDFYGEQTVIVGPGDTTHELIKEHVENGANNIGAVTEEVEDLNPDTDVGKLEISQQLKLPDGVEDKG